MSVACGFLIIVNWLEPHLMACGLWHLLSCKLVRISFYVCGLWPPHKCKLVRTSFHAYGLWPPHSCKLVRTHLMSLACGLLTSVNWLELHFMASGLLTNVY